MAQVAEHLSAQYDALAAKPSVTEGVVTGLESVQARVLASLQSSRTRVAQEPVNLSSYIEQRQAKQQSVEENIRDHRLKEATRLKQELEQKLEHLQDNIKTLEQDAEEPVNSQKLPILDSKARQAHFEEEERRRQETAEFAKKLRQDQLEIARRNKQREEELNRKVQIELDLAQKRREEEEALQQAEKAKKLADMQEKAKKRKENIEYRKRAASEETNRLRSQQYMHDRLSQDYLSKVLQTEQEKKQEILAKQHLLHQPIRLDEIQEHAKRYEELKRERQAHIEAERQNKILDSQISGISHAKGSSFTQAVLNQDKQTKMEQQQVAEAKRRLQEKKQRYALLVKEMFVPAVDPVKQKEMEVIKERLAHPVSHLAKNSTTRSLSDHPETASVFEPRKFRDNPMLPKPKPKKEAVVVDYLGERRNQRGSDAFSVSAQRGSLEIDENFGSDLNDGEKAKLIKMRAEKVERAAKRRELLLSQVNPTSPGALEAHESVNDALISSIRAKLSLLK